PGGRAGRSSAQNWGCQIRLRNRAAWPRARQGAGAWWRYGRGRCAALSFLWASRGFSPTAKLKRNLINVPPTPLFFFKNIIPNDLILFLRQQCDSKVLRSNGLTQISKHIGKASD